MKYITVTACLLAFAIALAAMFPKQAQKIHEAKVRYDVKQFCAEHPDVCSKSRLAHYATPSPIPSNKGFVVVLP